MTAIAKKLDARLKTWRSRTALKVEKLVADIIDRADRENSTIKPGQKPPAGNDSFLTDKKIFRGKTPKNLAANHDDFLYTSQ